MGVSQTFRVLGELPREAQLRFAEAALLEPYAELQAAAVEALADPARLGRPELVVRRFPELLPDLRLRVMAEKARFLEVARQESKSPHDAARRGAYALLAAAGDFDSAPALVAGLDDPSPYVREAVAEALEKLALRYRAQLAPARAGEARARRFMEDHRAVLLQILAAALRSFSSHRRGTFAEVLVDLGPDGYPLLSEFLQGRPDAPLYVTLVQVLMNTRSEAGIDVLVRLSLDDAPAVRQVAADVMRIRRDPGFPAALAEYFASLAPERLEALAVRTREVPWWPAVEALPDPAPAVAERLIAFLARSGLEPGRRGELLSRFLRSPHPEARERAFQALLALADPRVLDLAALLLDDPADPVRLAAARAIMALDPPQKLRLLAPRVNDPCEDVRRLAVREVSRVSFERYLRSFDRLDPATRQTAARALAKIDAAILDRLAEEVSSLDPERRLKALRIIEYVDAGEDLREPLVELLADPDRRVRATAIKVVELSGHVEGMKLLIAALSDPDPRVRANAIEAFEATGDARFAELLTPFLSDPDNRIRANAAKALFNLGRREGIETLQAMLADADEDMRLSAVWAMGELRYPGAREALEARAARDSSLKVRARIAEALGRKDSAAPLC